jgi:ribonucleoside-triphosphate reductase
VYYRPEEIGMVKSWLQANLDEIKTISFLKYTGHGFDQAPKEPISRELYEKLSSKIKPISEDLIGEGTMSRS